MSKFHASHFHLYNLSSTVVAQFLLNPNGIYTISQWNFNDILSTLPSTLHFSVKADETFLVPFQRHYNYPKVFYTWIGRIAFNTLKRWLLTGPLHTTMSFTKASSYNLLTFYRTNYLNPNSKHTSFSTKTCDPFHRCKTASPSPTPLGKIPAIWLPRLAGSIADTIRSKSPTKDTRALFRV